MKWKSGINWGIKNIKNPLPYDDSPKLKCSECGSLATKEDIGFKTRSVGPSGQQFKCKKCKTKPYKK